MSSRAKIFLCVALGLMGGVILSGTAMDLTSVFAETNEGESTLDANSAYRWSMHREPLQLGSRSAVSADEFAFRILGTTSGKQVTMRFRTRTGESWVREGVQWATVKDDAEINTGSFDIALQPTGDTYFAVRTDGTSGQAWLLTFDTEWKWLQIADSK